MGLLPAGVLPGNTASAGSVTGLARVRPDRAGETPLEVQAGVSRGAKRIV